VDGRALSQPVRGRVACMDTAKFVLVALVVVGHLIEQVRHFSPFAEAAYRYIYLFHIPALVFVSGAVATARFDVEEGKRWLAALVLPYLVFQALYLLADAAWQEKAFVFRVTTPYWLLWYLFSLAAWRLMLPVALSVAHPLLGSVLVAVAAGWLPDVGYPFSLSRTLVFFPFFVAGYLHGCARPRGPVVLAWLVLLVLAGVAWWARAASPMWLYGSAGYADLGARPWAGASARLILLMLGMAGTWAVLRLMPERDNVLAWLGRYSIGAYLLHGFLVRQGSAQGWYAALQGQPIWQLLLLLAVIGVVGTVVLCVCARWLRPFMHYGWLWNLRRTGSGSG